MCTRQLFYQELHPWFLSMFLSLCPSTQQLCDVQVIVIIPLIYRRKLRHRETYQAAQ